MTHKYKLLFAILVLMIFLSANSIADELKFGIQSSRGAIKTLKRWKQTQMYLEKELGSKVTIVPLNPAKTMKAVKAGKVDMMLSNPVIAVTLMESLEYKPLLTMSKKSGPRFGGVIFVRKDSGIKSVNDLKGKNVMAYKFKRSAAAYVFQVKHLKDKGIDAHKDFKSFRQAKKQDDIVLAVKGKLVDVGFVKTGLLEGMAKEGRINLDDFYIIDQVKDDFAHVHTTKLYPLWTLTASPKYDKAKVEKVKQALKKLKANHQASKTGKYTGFVEAIDLVALTETLKSLKLPPFAK